MSGAKILFVLLIINIGLVILAPSVFLGDNYAFEKISDTFGLSMFNDTIDDGTNMTMIILNTTDGGNSTSDALGLTNTGDNTTLGRIQSGVTAVFSPLIFILEFIKLIFGFAFAPIILMTKMGFPWYIRLLFGFPITVLYILAIASWMRGVKF